MVIGKHNAFLPDKKAVVLIGSDTTRFMGFNEWKDQYGDCYSYLKRWLFMVS